jgi:two-component system sensor histidine kinase TctE
MSSIRWRLLKWLIGPILAINLAGAALAYVLAWTPARMAFDQGLGDAAGALLARLRVGPHGPLLDLPPQAEQVLRADAVDTVYFVVRGGAGDWLAGDRDFPPLAAGPGGAAPATYDARMRGEAVRVATLSARLGPSTVRIGLAKTLRKRQQLRAAIVGALLPLEALFTLALVGLIWFSVSNGLLPLARLRAELKERDGADLAPIGDDAVPLELAPLVSAFNELLAKLQAGSKAQHAFVADVAHQLRTPLAGLQLQLEWLAARHGADPESLRAIGLMRLSGERMIRQSNQLLALARAEPSRFEKARLEPLDLAALVTESIQTFVEAAARKRIDLGFELAPTPVAGDRFLLRDLIDNLVDNALRYTPCEGTVTVRCDAILGQGRLTVEDSGPGIAAAMRERVFARFVRIDDKSGGSGLGLAIVRDIAQAHGARVTIESGARGGAVLTVRFPA